MSCTHKSPSTYPLSTPTASCMIIPHLEVGRQRQLSSWCCCFVRMGKYLGIEMGLKMLSLEGSRCRVQSWLLHLESLTGCQTHTNSFQVPRLGNDNGRHRSSLPDLKWKGLIFYKENEEVKGKQMISVQPTSAEVAAPNQSSCEPHSTR